MPQSRDAGEIRESELNHSGIATYGCSDHYSEYARRRILPLWPLLHYLHQLLLEESYATAY